MIDLRLLAFLLLTSCAAPEKTPTLRNTLGMDFLPVPGLTALLCRHETRVRDYAVFVKETGHEWPRPGFRQTGDHPAVNVSWADATAFCQWLSHREGRHYRLPTDAEWSQIVGIRELEGKEMAPKAQPQLPGHYPWGRQPFFVRMGNYADAAFGRRFDDGHETSCLHDREDHHAATAPVGKFQVGPHGLHDLGGNVWEWCEDWYDPPQNTLKVLRGGSWRTGLPARLLASYRGPDPVTCRLDSAGFRLLVEPTNVR